MQHLRTKNAPPKLALPWGPDLEARVGAALRLVSEMVGNTLGPGGRPVLIEHQEEGRAPFATKDGVTVARNLLGAAVASGGHRGDEHEQLAMEMAVESCLRTAAGAGDGTTTTAILAHALVSRTFAYCKANRRVSPHQAIRRLQAYLAAEVYPALAGYARPVSPDDDAGKALLRAVAVTSTNGDVELADAVVACLDITGDEGSVTIAEEAGPTAVRAERQDGYGLQTGYDDSCGRFYNQFINDQASQTAILTKPVFLLYHGRLDRVAQIEDVLKAVVGARNRYDEAIQSGAQWTAPPQAAGAHQVCLVAAGFSEQVVAYLGQHFQTPNAPRILPVALPPAGPVQGWQHQLLLDLAAVTGAKVHDQTTIRTFDVQDCGPGVEYVEMSRFRTNVVGYARGPRYVVRAVDRREPGGQVRSVLTYVALTDKHEITYEAARLKRCADVRSTRDKAGSELDRRLTTERLAKLANGLARLVVVGSSNAELRARRDSAEDAVCAVRAALSGGGVLPGACWALCRVARKANDGAVKADSKVRALLDDILVPALMEPLRRLLANAGLDAEDVEMVQTSSGGDDDQVYDAAEHGWVDAYEAGLLDAAPAVIEALRNAAAVAGVVGITGGSIAYASDMELARREALEVASYNRHAGVNEANERG